MDTPPRELSQVQRWLQAVIVHPEGIERGIESSAARDQIDVAAADVEQVIARSQHQTSLERLAIYGNAYYARLLECLRAEFPVLTRLLGEEAFNGFGFGYLQAYPSRSYTLAELGRHFPQYLAETRPAAAVDAARGPDWADFLIDLATVERTYSEVFDGPGTETSCTLSPEDVAAIGHDEWLSARLLPVPCLRLLRLRFPVHEYVLAVRGQSAAVSPPAPRETCLAVTRRDYVVRATAVEADEFEVLSALMAGETVGQAIARVADRPEVDWDALAGKLQTWFARWAAAPYFRGIDQTA
jgi:hypothetical protein